MQDGSLGSRRVQRARLRSARVAVLRLDPGQVRQLALDLALELGGPPKASRTFGELAVEWLRRIAKRRVCPANERRHIDHLWALKDLREGELTKGAIDDLFGMLLKPHGKLGPSTINKLRSTGRLIIRDASGNGLWTGHNPFDLVPRLRQPKAIHKLLTRAELVLGLAKLRIDRRRMAKTCLMVGLRPGEALGLLKVDVDLEHRLLLVRRSHGRDQTKTGKEREFPIPDDLVEDLRAAMAESKSQYVFPKADGTRQRSDTKLAKILRTALKAAGVVSSYRYRCRKYSCPNEVDIIQVELREGGVACPKCTRPMHCLPIAKRYRFYDLRHSSATLHRKAKCDPLVIQEMLGHVGDNTTDAVYTHLDDDYRRAELNKFKLEEGPVAETETSSR